MNQMSPDRYDRYTSTHTNSYKFAQYLEHKFKEERVGLDIDNTENTKLLTVKLGLVVLCGHNAQLICATSW